MSLWKAAIYAISTRLRGRFPFWRDFYLRDLVDIQSGYQSPANFLNYYSWQDAQGKWQRTRAVTLSVQMRKGEQIGKFSTDVNKKLDATRHLLPADLLIARTSDQPRQVKETVDLFAKQQSRAATSSVQHR